MPYSAFPTGGAVAFLIVLLVPLGGKHVLYLILHFPQGGRPSFDYFTRSPGGEAYFIHSSAFPQKGKDIFYASSGLFQTRIYFIS